MNKIYVVGCGGVGSYLIPALAKILANNPKFKDTELVLWDGDKLEKKNLARQQFQKHNVGEFKAEAMATLIDNDIEAKAITEFIHPGSEVDAGSLFLCLVDNHPARKSVLMLCDRFDCSAIFAANEMTSAQAYYYQPAWMETGKDPRVRYPTIVTDESDDPLHRGGGCNTVEVLAETQGQTASANFMAAGLAMQMFTARHVAEVDREFEDHLPIELSCNAFTFKNIKQGEL